MADAMQKKLQKLVKGLREDGIDLAETPALFKWSYEDDPLVHYELLITETTQAELIFDDDVVH